MLRVIKSLVKIEEAERKFGAEDIPPAASVSVGAVEQVFPKESKVRFSE